MNNAIVLQYLNCFDEGDERTNQLIDECLLEVKQIAYFKVTYQIFDFIHHPLTLKDINIKLESSDLEFYFEDCQKCLVIACTLGVDIDRRIKYYEHIDMAKAVVFDAVSSRYLEECCDEYEKTLNLKKHTFRFAPGYGNIPIELNKELGRILKIDKTIGVSINEGGLFIPMKSMLAMIGIGETHKKSCLSCIRKESCQLRKGGQRCYERD